MAHNRSSPATRIEFVHIVPLRLKNASIRRDTSACIAKNEKPDMSTRLCGDLLILLLHSGHILRALNLDSHVYLLREIHHRGLLSYMCLFKRRFHNRKHRGTLTKPGKNPVCKNTVTRVHCSGCKISAMIKYTCESA